MAKQPAFIRKHEARPTNNPQRVALLLAVFTALATVSVGLTFLYNTSDVTEPKNVVAVQVPAKAETIDVVVAKRNVAYNEVLKRSDLKIVSWPKDAKPAGAYTNVDALFSSAGERYFMAKLVMNEVILPSKLSEPGRKATLAALLRTDTRAVAVRVDDVLGVAGFVRPGDFVDVIMTRSSREEDNAEDYSVVLLQRIHVLGVDQTSRVTSNVSDVVKRAAKTVTLEVDLVGAQKLALANTVGRLSLALRRPRGTVLPDANRINISDLGQESITKTQGQLQLAASMATALQPSKRRTKTIGVTRAIARTELEVSQE